jgi:acylphosphatase
MSNSPSIDVVCAHVFISGRVQGVGYRYATEETATLLKLNGWVTNLPDKRVEAIFEGRREVVEQMIGWCRSGPPAALVEEVQVEYIEPEGFQRFEVRRL